METAQAEMINLMEVESFTMDEDVSCEIQDLSLPLQTLFDECLNFISMTDIEM